jgi:hypothetical protein
LAQVIGSGALIQDTIDAMLMGPPKIHSKATDVQVYSNMPGWRLITYAAGALAMVLSSPKSGDDDFKLFQFVSATNQAHTVTAPGALFANGTALKTTATFAAFAGAGFICRLYQGIFLVQYTQGITFS